MLCVLPVSTRATRLARNQESRSPFYVAPPAWMFAFLFVAEMFGFRVLWFYALTVCSRGMSSVSQGDSSEDLASMLDRPPASHGHAGAPSAAHVDAIDSDQDALSLETLRLRGSGQSSQARPVAQPPAVTGAAAASHEMCDRHRPPSISRSRSRSPPRGPGHGRMPAAWLASHAPIQIPRGAEWWMKYIITAMETERARLPSEPTGVMKHESSCSGTGAEHMVFECFGMRAETQSFNDLKKTARRFLSH
eukprot:6500084-Pyramimonas_sp.AAC.1